MKGNYYFQCWSSEIYWGSKENKCVIILESVDKCCEEEGWVKIRSEQARGVILKHINPSVVS